MSYVGSRKCFSLSLHFSLLLSCQY
jgi:hypothetical protein